MQALILGGGEGQRMRHVTAHVPKPLLYLPGGTLLEHQLALLAELRVTRVFVITRHLGRDINKALRGWEGVTPVPQKPPYTLLGALASAEGLVQEPFIVIHGDNYFSHGLEYVIQEASLVRGDSRPRAIFATDDGRPQGDLAGRLASTGCYVLSPGVFRLVRGLANRDDLRSLTEALLESGTAVGAVPLRGWRANINVLGDLLAVSRRMLEQWPEALHPRRAVQGYGQAGRLKGVEPPVWISPEARVRCSRLGPSVVVGPGATVRDCVLRNAIVFPGAEIEGERVVDGIVIPSREGPLVLASDGDVDGGQQRKGEEEPPQLSPATDE